MKLPVIDAAAMNKWMTECPKITKAEEMFRRMSDKIREEQPMLAGFMRSLATMNKTSWDHSSVLMGCYITYRMLELAAEEKE